MAKKKKTPAQRRDAHDKQPPVDSFKRLHVAIALAPVFATQMLDDGTIPDDTDYEATAIQLVRLATAIARRL